MNMAVLARGTSRTWQIERLQRRRTALWQSVLQLGMAKERVIAAYRRFCELPLIGGPGVPCSPGAVDVDTRARAVREARRFMDTLKGLEQELEAVDTALDEVEHALLAAGVDPLP